MNGPELYRRARQLIPGGTQLFSKRPELFAPDVWPAYYSRAKGVDVWGVDGTRWIDMSILNVGACILGYADDEVDGEVIKSINNGVSSSLNCPEEVQLAELLVELHPWVEMVRYSRSGGEAMSNAIRIARAATARDLVVFSGYHGCGDWYLAANLSSKEALDGHLMPGLDPVGVPKSLEGTSVPFLTDSIKSLKSAIQGRENEVAAIVLEPARAEEAQPNYLLDLKKEAESIGAVLIFDEITSAFRMNPGCIHLRYNVNPHLAVIAKSMANGYAMSAIMGVSDVMEAAQKTFLSSTNWTERIGPTASLATIEKYVDCRVDQHIIKMGNRVKEIWKNAAIKNSIPIQISGLPTLANFQFDLPNNQELQTLFTTLMLDKGFLAFRQFKPCLAHQNVHIDQYGEAVDEVFGSILKLDASESLRGPVAHKGFKRLTRE